MVRVLGVDAAAKHGWVGVVCDDDGFREAHIGSLAEIVTRSEPISVVAIDIPIGNVPGGRAADKEARRFLGPRRSSVFATPPAIAAAPASYAEANALLADLGLPKMSRQAWALLPKIVEAATLAAADDRLFEVHPEVSFCEMAGEHLRWSKKSWNGLQSRRTLLAAAGIDLPDVIESVGAVASDDVVDAAAVAWTALRIARGAARSLPDPPQTFGGRAVAIWC
ncbi:MAG: DUF429 domain-containing protein [Acidimicrobiales bacterium]